MTEEDIFTKLMMLFGGEGVHYNFYASEKRNTLLRQTTDTFGQSAMERVIKRVRDLFRKYDDNGNGILERHEIKVMIQDTYTMLNKNYNPTETEVEQYMHMMDKNSNGEVTLDEYEVFVLKSLDNRDIKLDMD